ncbi:hypothetical protein RCZAHN_59 [Rhodobacter phage RcZahn]|nr:hypothetical protein RCZAHN_59 [Rhodobacter phage RcZahn]
MPLKISTKKATPAKATVSTELKESGKVVAENSHEETPNLGVKPNISGEQWCAVGFEASYTHNLGNYQSARVQVSLSIPCPHSEIDDVYDMAKSWVDARVQKLVEELNGDE